MILVTTFRRLLVPLVAFLVANVAGADDEARTALVVGVENYDDIYFKALGAPVADARAIQTKLQSLGFQVDLLVNPTRRQLTEAVDTYGSTLARRGGVGLFYFSGHGAMKSDETGTNYLIPARTNIRTENDLPEEAFNAQRVANRMKEARNRLNLVFLDACRNHALPKGDGAKSSGGGLSAMRGATGLMFCFATQPGEVAIEDTAKRSLFTVALLKYMDSPGLSFMDMLSDVTAETERSSVSLTRNVLRQSPFISGTLSGRFYFNPNGVPAASVPIPDRPARSFLGIALQPLSEEMAREFKIDNNAGALVSDVISKSPADMAGVQVGDVVVEAGGKKVGGPRELQLMVAAFAPGTKVQMKLMRDGKEKAVTVELSERPPAKIAATEKQSPPDQPDVLAGLTVADIDADARKKFGLPDGAQGVVATEIDPQSPGAAVGLKVGDVIQEINREPITSSKQVVELREKVKMDKKILLRVSTKGAIRFVLLVHKD